MLDEFNPFAPIAAKIYGFVALVAIAGVGLQTARIEGLKIWPIEIVGLEQTVATRTAERDAEIAAHRQTKATYRAAQVEAARIEAERIARVRAEQQEITNDVTQDYRNRLADARAAAERMRDALRARTDAVGASESVAVPGAADPSSRADQATDDRRLSITERLIATEQAIQLDALIDWVTKQGAVDPNR
jgi:signal transduction histidine kinase